MMKFTQIIEFTTTRIDDFNAHLDAWMAETEGRRIPHRAVLRRDRDTTGVYLLTVEFASHEVGMENSSRPETGEFAAFLSSISEGDLTFRNLDVLREEHRASGDFEVGQPRRFWRYMIEGSRPAAHVG